MVIIFEDAFYTGNHGRRQKWPKMLTQTQDLWKIIPWSSKQG